MKISREDFFKLKSELSRPREIVILTGSMSPFISPGDKITVFPLGGRELKKFDPIVFWREQRLICHFFYRKEFRDGKELVITKALNSSKEDPPIDQDQVLGIVIRPTLPKWKRLLLRLLK